MIDNATRRKIHCHRSKEVYEMELGRERLSNFFKDFKKFWNDLKVDVDENKLVKRHTHFEKDYLEVFKVEIEEKKAAVQ